MAALELGRARGENPLELGWRARFEQRSTMRAPPYPRLHEQHVAVHHHRQPGQAAEDGEEPQLLAPRARRDGRKHHPGLQHHERVLEAVALLLVQRLRRVERFRPRLDLRQLRLVVLRRARTEALGRPPDPVLAYLSAPRALPPCRKSSAATSSSSVSPAAAWARCTWPASAAWPGSRSCSSSRRCSPTSARTRSSSPCSRTRRASARTSCTRTSARCSNSTRSGAPTTWRWNTCAARTSADSSARASSEGARSRCRSSAASSRTRRRGSLSRTRFVTRAAARTGSCTATSRPRTSW